jgi:acyl-CoA synthetase (NDP forming)
MMTTPVASDLGRVRQLFNPGSIALIGATDKSRWSWNTFANLQLHGFAGPVYLVNPRGIPVHGQQACARVADLPAAVDLAFVMVPTSAVLGVLDEVADHAIPSVVLLTSGFAEVGDRGAELERQVADLARRRGLTILGPNGNGYINATAGITPYGLPIDSPLRSGPVGVVLQSGALASSVLNFAQSRNVGVSLLVSMGNESMVSMTDVMRYLIDDDATRAIALFIESVRRPGEVSLGCPRSYRRRGLDPISCQDAGGPAGRRDGRCGMVSSRAGAPRARTPRSRSRQHLRRS